MSSHTQKRTCWIAVGMVFAPVLPVLADEFEANLAILRNEGLHADKRIAAAKKCMDDGPLDPRVLDVLVANMDSVRVIPSLDYVYLADERDYRYPYWRLLIDKKEAMPALVEAALDLSGGMRKALGVWGLSEQKRRGFDATELLEKAIAETSDEEVVKRARSLIKNLGHRRPLEVLPVPEYKKPPPKPRPPKPLPPRKPEIAQSNPDAPETGTQPPPSAKAPASAEKPLASAGMSGRPWLLAGGGVAVFFFLAVWIRQRKPS